MQASSPKNASRDGRQSLQSRLAELPSVQSLLDDVSLADALALGRTDLKRAIQHCLEKWRTRIRAGQSAPERQVLVADIGQRLHNRLQPRLQPVINATGVIVHTNLGRAPLSPLAMARVLAIGSHYNTLEYALETGERGSRQAIVEELLTSLTGAEAALVVNNNAAAVLLALTAIASGKEVVISRGEQVEIGGSFRIPDILEQSGCILKEVGTTNRTHLRDYARALSPQTGLLLKVHPSNYRVIGFVAEVSPEALVALASPHGIPVMEDLGSGCLLNLSANGLPGEPTAQERLASGLDLLSMSGDKVLGGPQAGILLGKRTFIERCRVHPLARALRIDKLCLAALEGTLMSYRAGRATLEVPVLDMLTRTPGRLREQAEALRVAIDEQLQALPDGPRCLLQAALEWQLEASDSRVGGGAWPEQPLPTWVVSVRVRPNLELESATSGGSKPEDGKQAHSLTASRIEAALRRSTPPIIARQKEGCLLFDPRTLLTGDGQTLAEGLVRSLASLLAPEG